MKTLVVFAAILLTFAFSRTESWLTGKWQGETPGGASLVLDLTVKGTALTGTLTRNGQSATISDGSASKDTFSFKATLDGKVDGFSGERDGDRIKVWLDRQGPSKAVLLTRVKTL